jgi:hypothetical protein
MLIKEIITESYYDTFVVNNEYAQNIQTEVFKNPSTREFKELQHEHGSVRGFLHVNDVYIWRADVLHHSLEIPGDHHLAWSHEDDATFRVVWFPDIEDGYPLQDEYSEIDLKEYISSHPVLHRLTKGYSIQVDWG